MSTEQSAPAASDALRHRLRWFLFGRVLMTSAFLGGLSLTSLGGLKNPYVVSNNLLFSIVVATYVFTMVSAVLLQRLRELYAFCHVQVAFDVLLTTGVLYLTGGPDSPFAFLYTLPVSLFGISVSAARRLACTGPAPPKPTRTKSRGS